MIIDLPNISLSYGDHRDREVVFVRFLFDQFVINRLKEKTVARWSASKKCWYINKVDFELSRFFESFRRLAYVDYSGLKGKDESIPDNIKQLKSKHPANELKPKTLEKIEEMRQWMKQKRYSGSTVNTYFSFVKQFFVANPTLEWNKISHDDIEKYNYEYFIKGKLSYSSQNQWINAVKLFLKVHNLMESNELNNIERPLKQRCLPDVLSPEEVRQVIEKLTNIKHRTLLMLVYSCGLRIGEALRMKVYDIKSGEGLIYIRQSKGAKDRRVPLSVVMLEQLRKYYKTHNPKKYLFEGQKPGRPYTSQSAAKVLGNAVKQAGITKHVTMHTLRHSYATHLTNRGVNIQYLQEILGHNSPKTTMLYTHLSGKDIRNIKSPLDDLGL